MGVDFAVLSPAEASVPASVLYQVRPADPRAHVFEVRCTLHNAPAEALAFRLPAWIRGSYLIRDFAKHVIELQARRGESPVAVKRLDKRSIEVPAGIGPIELLYRVFAFDESVRKAWLDTQRGFFNGSSLFYCPDGYADRGFEVLIHPPEDPDCADWRVATSMPALDIDAAGFGRYGAPDYEALIDHPVELGKFRRQEFEVDGIPHSFVLSGRVDADLERICSDLRKICIAERALFEQQPALPQYLFLTHAVASGYGGLEHRDSTALICSRGDLPPLGQTGISKEYRQFLGLCSHEYFHLWNVKRITAQRFLDSELGAEAYTADLWHYEGITSYYDDLFLLRAGLIDVPAYLDLVAEQATRLERSPACGVHTLADASYETWIKYYQPDENAINASTNYYVKGALVALCLDLTLRRAGAHSLDEVMRALWARYGAAGLGVPEGGLEAVAEEISGLQLRPFFDRCLRSTDPLPLAELLAEFGVRCERRAMHHALDGGGRSSGRAPSAWAGLRLRAGDTTVAQVLNGSPAERAGLSPGDQLVALRGLRLNANGWTRTLEALAPNQSHELHFFRGEELMQTRIEFTAPPLDTWTLTVDDGQDACVRARVRWLGQ